MENVHGTMKNNLENTKLNTALDEIQRLNEIQKEHIAYFRQKLSKYEKENQYLQNKPNCDDDYKYVVLRNLTKEL